MPFKKGNPGGPGRAPGHHDGRKPDRFKELCRRALDDADGIGLMVNIAKGKEFPQLATREGEVLPLPPELRERRAAVEWLADRAYGKPHQSIDVEVTDEGERPKADELIAARERLRADRA